MSSARKKKAAVAEAAQAPRREFDEVSPSGANKKLAARKCNSLVCKVIHQAMPPANANQLAVRSGHAICGKALPSHFDASNPPTVARTKIGRTRSPRLRPRNCNGPQSMELYIAEASYLRRTSVLATLRAAVARRGGSMIGTLLWHCWRRTSKKKSRFLTVMPSMPRTTCLPPRAMNG